jgi:phospholipid/cholesterol/gamma-HCH transport system ATP-binding protein
VNDHIDAVAATDDAWIQDYFHGPRGRAAQTAATVPSPPADPLEQR